MKRILTATAVLSLLSAAPALAELSKIQSKDEFNRIIDGKTLTRPLVRLQVSPAGVITGKGAAWDVSGQWTWKGGYFCRSLKWGGDDLGYNCQQVEASDGRIRFTSDQGAGDSAEFRLR